jgi:hypothetical protein
MRSMHAGATGRENHPSYQSRAEAPRSTAGWLKQLQSADRACCCTAPPVVMVVMPATSERSRPVDLLLCGHHYRASQRSLEAAGAVIFDSRVILAEAGGDVADPAPVR